MLEGLDWERLDDFDRALADRERGMLLIAEGELGLAATTLEKVWLSVQTGPTPLKSSTALALGWVQTQLGHGERAMHVLEEAVALTQGSRGAQARATRGICHLYSGRFKAAEEDFVEARRLSPIISSLSATLAYSEGVLYRAQGRYGESLQAFQEALSGTALEDEVAFFSELGVCALHGAMGEFQLAAGSLARASKLKEHPRRLLYWNWRAALLRQQQGGSQSSQLALVREGFVRCGLMREAGWVSLCLAESLLSQRDIEGARAALDQAADIRHAFGRAAAPTIELRDLVLVRQYLAEFPHGYSSVLLADWTALKGNLPHVISLVTLGGSQILMDGKPVQLRLRRSTEILAYLLLRGRTTRERLLTDLWPEKSPKDAGNYFHQIRHKMETALPGLKIPYDSADGTYGVRLEGPRLEWDVQRVKRLLSGPEEDVSEAIQAYTGVFMPSVGVSWAQEVGRELEWSVIKSGLQLMDRWNADGQTGKCLELAHRLREIEPYNEVLAEYLVMAVLDLEGYIAAKRTLEQVVTQFETEFGEIPERLLNLHTRLAS